LLTVSIYTTRKSINTNGNTEGITVGKKIKTKQKKMMTCQDLPTELLAEFIPSVKSVGKSIGKL
jgi:hypothetical protein